MCNEITLNRFIGYDATLKEYGTVQWRNSSIGPQCAENIAVKLISFPCMHIISLHSLHTRIYIYSPLNSIIVLCHHYHIKLLHPFLYLIYIALYALTALLAATPVILVSFANLITSPSTFTSKLFLCLLSCHLPVKLQILFIKNVNSILQLHFNWSQISSYTVFICGNLRLSIFCAS